MFPKSNPFRGKRLFHLDIMKLWKWARKFYLSGGMYSECTIEQYLIMHYKITTVTGTQGEPSPSPVPPPFPGGSGRRGKQMIELTLPDYPEPKRGNCALDFRNRNSKFHGIQHALASPLFRHPRRLQLISRELYQGPAAEGGGARLGKRPRPRPLWRSWERH